MFLGSNCKFLGVRIIRYGLVDGGFLSERVPRAPYTVRQPTNTRVVGVGG